LIELNNDFNHIDNSIRSLSRAISYSTMISAFGDEAVWRRNNRFMIKWTISEAWRI
jgi:hypothetical protein